MKNLGLLVFIVNLSHLRPLNSGPKFWLTWDITELTSPIYGIAIVSLG